MLLNLREPNESEKQFIESYAMDDYTGWYDEKPAHFKDALAFLVSDLKDAIRDDTNKHSKADNIDLYLEVEYMLHPARKAMEIF